MDWHPSIWTIVLAVRNNLCSCSGTVAVDYLEINTKPIFIRLSVETYSYPRNRHFKTVLIAEFACLYMGSVRFHGNPLRLVSLKCLNVTFGGTLVQDIPSQLPGTLRHMQIPVDRTEPTHSVDIVKDTYLYKVFETDTILTNSFHHQCIQTVAPGFSVSAKARDGVIEAIEVKEEHILGVQWHPEEMVHAHPEHFGLFRQFVGAAAGAID